MQLQLKSKFIWCFVLLFTKLTAQQFPSTHFTIRDGLPSNAVYCVFKDSRGLIWIGTDAGLVKYDGFHFKTFTNKNGLAGNFIRDIKEDRKGNLWIACYGDGLTRFDGKKFKNFSAKNGLVHPEIRRLFFDKKQQLWIGTERGVSVLSDNRFFNFETQVFDKYNRFQVMQFWEEKNELYFLSRSHGYFKAKFHSEKLSCSKIGKLYSQIFMFKVGEKSYFSYHNGLSVDTTESHFPIDSTKVKHLSSNIVWDVTHTKSGTLLAANSVYRKSGGLLLLKNGNLTDVSTRFGIQSKQLWSFYKDKKEGKLWVTTLDNGVYIIDENPEFYKTKSTDIIDYWEDANVRITLSEKGLSIQLANGLKYEIPPKEFYLRTTKKQLIFLDENPNQKGEHIKIAQLPVNLKSFLLKKVQVFGRKIYVSSNSGFFEVSMQGKILNVVNIETDHFLVTDKHVLYYCPDGNLALLRKTASNKWLVTYTQPNSIDEPKSTIKIVQLKDDYLFASSLYGVFMLNSGQVKTRKIKLPTVYDYKIKDICSDGKNKFYIVNSGNELLGFTWINGKVRLTEHVNISKIEGETILKLAHDGKNLFVLTNRGLNVFTPQNTIFRDKEQGFSFNNVSYFNVNHGKLMVVTDIGTYYWDVQRLVNNKKQQQYARLTSNLSGVKRNLPIFKYSYSKQSIVIPLNRTFLYHGKKMHFAYSLNGKNWTRFNGSMLVFNQLESGSYTVKIRQTDLFTGQSEVYPLLKIAKEKPFWRKPLFLTFSLLCFIGIFWLILRFRFLKNHQREQQKSELLKRIAETKLEALQSQMNPHFIFNSLTAIHSYIIKSDVDNALLYMDKFAKLTRQTLEFSSLTKISLLEEFEYLSHFIAMENMRFGNRVKVNIDAGEIDTLKVFVPPLLIQPLIENAFEHGFTNRDENYSLELSFEIEQEQLQIIISDDGEGFSSNKTNPESKAINIIRERLQLIDPKLVEFFTLAREDNRTVVRFVLPLISL